MSTRRLKKRLVGSPDSISGRYREKRWRLLLETFPDLQDMRVLDLGGTATAWQPAPGRVYSSPVRPAHVTVINLEANDLFVYSTGEPAEDVRLSHVVGDACDASQVLAAAGLATDFDLVYSNSLIEHVGGHSQRVKLADQIRRLAPSYWVQVPYKYFPIEPHWMFPAMQFMPTNVRMKVAMHWPLAPVNSPDPDSARDYVLSTELMGITEMRGYFPDSVILKEKFVGIPKSLIAVRV